MWKKFKIECPIISRIPILNVYCYRIFIESYIEQKIKNGTLSNYPLVDGGTAQTTHTIRNF